MTQIRSTYLALMNFAYETSRDLTLYHRRVNVRSAVVVLPQIEGE